MVHEEVVEVANGCQPGARQVHFISCMNSPSWPPASEAAPAAASMWPSTVAIGAKAQRD